MLINCPSCESTLHWPTEKVCPNGHTMRSVAGIPICFDAETSQTKFTADPLYPFEHAAQIAEKLARANNFDESIDLFFEIREQELKTNLEREKNLITRRTVTEINECIADASLLLNRINKPFPENTRLHLDIGCGMGFGLISSSKSYFGQNVVGIDLSPHYLVMSKLLLKEYETNTNNLLCADICDQWPIPLGKHDISFISMEGVLEHIKDLASFFDNIKKIKSFPFLIYLTVPYRWSFLPESHFNLRFVGWLPEKWQDKYIAWRLRVSELDHVNLYSIPSLRKTLENHFSPDSLVIELNDEKLLKRHYLRCAIYVSDANCLKSNQ